MVLGIVFCQNLAVMFNSVLLDQNKKTNVLALGPQDVYPPVDGGKEGIYGALRALAHHANVIYAYPSNGETPIDGYEKIGVAAVRIPLLPVERLWSILISTLTGKPYKFHKYCNAAAVRALDASLPNVPISAIVCHHAHTYRLAQRFSRLRKLAIPIIVREHNIEYQLVYSYRDSQRGVRRVVASFFAWLTKREECRIWGEADAVAFLSDQDLRTAQAVAGADSRHLFLAREGSPLPARWKCQYPGAQAPLLVLLNPKATQSVYNLCDFIHFYWLPLHERNGLDNVELHVTGVTNEELSRLLGLDVISMLNAGITGLGFLLSLEATFKGALALVSPTFVGGGIRKKILEAMAHQLPVIATDFDIATCDYFKQGVNILRMGDVNSFAEVVKLLRNDKLYWLNVSANARNTVEEFASWNGYGDAMINVIKDLLHDQASVSD